MGSVGLVVAQLLEMALVCREAAALEGRIERDLASQVSNYKQLMIAKRAVLEEEKMREEADMRSEERIARLRKVTEEMLTVRNEYAVSTRDLVMKAIKEDEAAVAASRTSKKTTIINQGTVAA